MHDSGDVPKTCIASSLIGSAAVVSAVMHHGSSSSAPSKICVISGLVGAAGVGYAVSAHASFKKIPMSCKVYSALGIALLLGGVSVLAKK